MPRPDWIEVGRVSRPHGVHGEVRIVPSSDNPERFTPSSVLYARPGRLGVAGPRLREQIRLTISAVRGDEGFPILGFREVTSREAAEALRGYLLEVRSNQLPELEEDEFYPFDLVGLEVRDQSGAVLGRVTDVMDSPAHPLLQVSRASEAAGETSEELIPFVSAAVPVVSCAEGYLEVAPGFLADRDGLPEDCADAGTPEGAAVGADDESDTGPR
jgi:16S rRNA processing protein RimM